MRTTISGAACIDVCRWGATIEGTSGLGPARRGSRDEEEEDILSGEEEPSKEEGGRKEVRPCGAYVRTTASSTSAFSSTPAVAV